jgi:HSP20 family molecular chaperone IbpA
MARDDHRDWMWSEALNMLAQADRLHRQVFRPMGGRPRPMWEPPVDMLETADALIVVAGLPGVDADAAQAAIEDGVLIISGERTLPPELRTAHIHRMELPQGRFERRIPLPAGRYGAIHRFAAHGCLVVRLAKAGA